MRAPVQRTMPFALCRATATGNPLRAKCCGRARAAPSACAHAAAACYRDDYTASIKKKAKKGGTKKGAAAQEDKAKAEQARKAAASGLAVRAATAPLGASPSFLPRLPPPAFHHDMSAAAPPPGHHRIASARLVARVCAPHASMPCWRRRASARSPPAANPPSNYCGRCRNGTQRTQAREDGVCQQAAGARSGGGGGVETTRGGRR